MKGDRMNSSGLNPFAQQQAASLMAQQQRLGVGMGIGCASESMDADYIETLRRLLKDAEAKASAKLDHLGIVKDVLARNDSLSEILMCLSELGVGATMYAPSFDHDRLAFNGLSLTEHVNLVVEANTQRRDAARQAIGMLNDGLPLKRFLELYAAATN